MAMGRRQKLDGWEYDFVGKCRHFLVWARGEKRFIKKKMNRRFRKAAKKELRKDI